MRPADNPFRSERLLAVRYRLRGETWESLLERLRLLRFRAAIVGPRGSGKTTLLEDLAARLSAAGRPVALSSAPEGAGAGWRLRPAPGPDDVVLLDSAERLPFRAWLHLRRATLHTGGLVVTAHRRGLLATLVTCRTDTTLLDEILGELLGGPSPADVRSAARAAFERSGGDVRATLRELYDLAAGDRLEGLRQDLEAAPRAPEG